MKFYIKKPTNKDPDKKIKSKKGQRKTFSIYKRTTRPDSSTANETIESKEIDAINAQYLSGTISYDLALRNIKKVFANFQRSEGIRILPDVFNNQNQKILENYWKTEYEDRDLVDPASARYRLQRAITALGNVSLLSATKEQLQKQVDSWDHPNDKQRENIGKLNLLLKFIKRDIKLKKKRKERKKVKYLTAPEMVQIAIAMKDPIANQMVRLAFYSGARQGELYSLSKDSYNGRVLYIDAQIDKADIERDPKWGSKRKSYLIEEGLDAFNFWCVNKAQLTLSRGAISKRFATACKKIFRDKDKWCKFHDLRHSYAIYLLAKGVNLTLVAQSIGDSVAVAQEYYAGFSLTDETVETIDRIVKKAV